MECGSSQMAPVPPGAGLAALLHYPYPHLCIKTTHTGWLPPQGLYGASAAHRWLLNLQGQGDIFFLAATLRPETMYGQLNCWMLPKGMYGAFRGLNGAIYVMAQRSARNLSWQDKMPKQGEPECLLQVSGQDLLGTKLQVSLSLLAGA